MISIINNTNLSYEVVGLMLDNYLKVEGDRKKEVLSISYKGVNYIITVKNLKDKKEFKVERKDRNGY